MLSSSVPVLQWYLSIERMVSLNLIIIAVTVNSTFTISMKREPYKNV